MDKNTLSNYGWVVIAVLVLSVMIALATPFGTYIRQGVESTTAGLFDTSEKAMNVVGMSDSSGNFEDGSGSSETPATPIDYEIIEGANQTVATTDASFRSTADYNKFESVKVDNNIVNPSNYSVSEGSTIINFKGEYFATLSNGTHKLEVVSTDGSASCEFTVNIAFEPEENVYELSGVWKFNVEQTITESIELQKINFTTAGNETGYGIEVKYNAFTLPSGYVQKDSRIGYEVNKLNGTGTEIYYPYDEYENFVGIEDTNGRWSFDEDMTIDFGSEPQVVSKEFYNWFTTNATKNG